MVFSKIMSFLLEIVIPDRWQIPWAVDHARKKPFLHKINEKLLFVLVEPDQP